MTQVKSYIISYLVPKAINSSLCFLTPDLSLTYLGLLEQTMTIEEHLKEYNPIRIAHYDIIQSMHNQLLECKGIKLDTKYIANYETIFKNFLKTIKVKKEMHKVNGYKILKQYMLQYYTQLLQPQTDYKDQEQILLQGTFMGEITSQLLVDLEDYYETVREEAQSLLVCMTQRFLPPQIALNDDQMNLIQVLKTNVKGGWPNSLNGQLKDAAVMERDMLKYIFGDVIGFMLKIITILMDETHGRENIIKFLKLINVAAPFLMMNDYRVAKQGNALRRVVLLENLL